MVRVCAFPNCPNKMVSWTQLSFHRLPLRNLDILKLWLVVLKIDPNTKVEELRRADHRVCSAHFATEDYFPAREKKEGQEVQRLNLRKNAIPMVAEDTTDTLEESASGEACIPEPDFATPIKSEHRADEEPPGSSGLILVLTGPPQTTTHTRRSGKYIALAPTWSHAVTETTVEPTASVIGRRRTDIAQWKAPVKKTSSVPGLFGNKLPTSLKDVIVNLDCLLKLFRKCGQCRGDCVVNSEGDRWCLMVVQRCQNCNHLNSWNSQPCKINETVRQNVNILQESASQPCEVRDGDQAWTDALRIKEEETDGETDATPSREQNLVDGGEEGSNEAVNWSEMNGLEMTRDCNYSEEEQKEEVEKCSEEEGAMEEKEDEEQGWDENEEEEEEDDDNDDSDEWEMDDEEEEEDDEEEEEDEEEDDGEQQHEVQKKKRGVNNIVGMKFGKCGRIPSKLLGQKVLCPECGILYSTFSHRCNPKKKFQCPDCDRCFVSESSLDAHRSSACKGKTNYPCKFCFQPCKTWQEKLIHQKSHPETQLFLCLECPQTFHTVVQRNNHLREQHPKKYECPTCHKVFQRHNLLARHVLSHSTNKPFKCQVCSRLFAQASQLKCHMRIHTGERPYQCRLCPKSFNHNVSLKNHVRRYHQGEIQHNPGSDNESAEQRLSCLSPDSGTDGGEIHNRTEKQKGKGRKEVDCGSQGLGDPTV